MIRGSGGGAFVTHRGISVTSGLPGVRRKPIIGLAGGIGSGKSSVARVFESLGAAVIDSDRLSHEQLADPVVRERLRQWWGGSLFTPDGAVDRKALAAIVFRDPEALRRLEGLLYPRIERRREELVAGLQRDPRVVAIVIDAPKLFEVGLDRRCDAVVFVEADRTIRLDRVRRARGWTPEELDRRENLQIPLDSKRENADHIVVNNSTVEELRPDIERILASVISSLDEPHGGEATAGGH